MPVIAEPQQGRSRASTERTLAAVLALVAEQGLDGLTINSVAARAGVSVGTIYGRFGDKDSLVLAAQDRFLDDVARDVGARLASLLSADRTTDDAQLVQRIVFLAVGVFRDHQTLIAQFLIRSRSVPALDARAEATVRDLSAQVVAAMTPHHARFTHPDPAVAIDVVFRTIVATLERRATSGPAFLSSVELDWDQLATELSALAIAYLGLTPNRS